MLMRSQVIVSTVLQLIAAGILLQTLFFKFTGPAKTVAAQEKNFNQLLASIALDK